MEIGELIRFIKETLNAQYQKSIATASVYEMHEALSRALLGTITDKWRVSARKNLRFKRAYYLSAEFLIGRMVYNNLLALGLGPEFSRALSEQGFDLARLDEIPDPALGNGGLGRLAACFLDSAATQDYPLDGYGIRYKYGLFKQKFVDGFQAEEADDWTRYGDPWSIRREEEAVLVKFGDQTVRAVPYDMPVIGYQSNNVNTLRLWQSEPMQDFDFEAFSEQKYDLAVRERNRAEDICRVLYPNDDTNEGKMLRLKQEYFFCSASVQDIVRRHVRKWGLCFDNFHEFCAIQLNDTHPAVAICELIRILCEDYDVRFDKAEYIAQKSFSYTNHTVMAEALESWNGRLFKKVLPKIYDYIVKLNAHQTKAFGAKGGAYRELLDQCRIISGGKINMANLAIYCSSHVNGVANMHTQILRRDVLKEWYLLFPERFQNKTNGITPRRWLSLCNPELAALITRQLDTDAWVKDLSLLRGLARLADDERVLDEFAQVKQLKKQQLSDYIGQQEGISLPPEFMFDVQIKRLHEYKRQLLNAFSVMDIYFGIKSGAIKSFAPTAFIFGGKAAPGYYRAKGIIKYINEIAKLINSDPQMQELMRVVFVQDYNVSYAEKIIPAADLSEQISTAGTEASGTGNMKLMLNGAPTVGTYDGANVEIVAESGTENNFLFGARMEELVPLRDSYDPLALYNANPRIKRVVDTLIDGTFNDDGSGMFEELYAALLTGASWHKPDHYFVLHDFEPYVQAKLQANADYGRDLRSFRRKGWMNIAGAGIFSSDRTIAEYAQQIWHIGKV